MSRHPAFLGINSSDQPPFRLAELMKLALRGVLLYPGPVILLGRRLCQTAA
jgi:hypothetical protein